MVALSDQLIANVVVFGAIVFHAKKIVNERRLELCGAFDNLLVRTIANPLHLGYESQCANKWLPFVVAVMSGCWVQERRHFLVIVGLREQWLRRRVKRLLSGR